MPLRNKNSAVAACALLALAMSLTGCENIPWNPDRWGAERIDVLSTEGRTGSVPMNYDTLMRLGAGARSARSRGAARNRPGLPENRASGVGGAALGARLRADAERSQIIDADRRRGRFYRSARRGTGALPARSGTGAWGSRLDADPCPVVSARRRLRPGDHTAAAFGGRAGGY